jgi:hypothetical protein
VRADALSGGGLAGLAALAALTRLELLDPRAAAAGGLAAAVAALTGLEVLLPPCRPAAPACRSRARVRQVLPGRLRGVRVQAGVRAPWRLLWTRGVRART